MQQPVPEGSVVITPTEIYNEVRDLTTVVRDLVTRDKAEEAARAELRARVDRVEATVETKADRIDVAKLDGRVSAVEKKLLLAAGFAAACGAGAGSWLSTVLGH